MSCSGQAELSKERFEYFSDEKKKSYLVFTFLHERLEILLHVGFESIILFFFLPSLGLVRYQQNFFCRIRPDSRKTVTEIQQTNAKRLKSLRTFLLKVKKRKIKYPFSKERRS